MATLLHMAEVLINHQVLPPEGANCEDRAVNDRVRLHKHHVYDAVFRIIFASCRDVSHAGRQMNCGDGLTRHAHIDIVMGAIDGEEATFYCHCRAANANFPCPRCLTHKKNLDQLSTHGPLRTVATMRKALHDSFEAEPDKAEQILRNNGLHAVEISRHLLLVSYSDLIRLQHFLWSFRNSDPYLSYGHDLLHADDLGEWGGHLWPLLCAVLKADGVSHIFNAYMARFPRWPGLKHFYVTQDYAATDIDYSDGNTFFAILQVG